MLKYLSNDYLERILSEAANEERLALTREFEPSASHALEHSVLRKKVCFAAGHGLMNWARADGVPYAEILSDASAILTVPDCWAYYSSKPLGFSIASADRPPKEAPGALPEAHRRDVVRKYVKEHQRRLLAKLALDIYAGILLSKKGASTPTLSAFQAIRGWADWAKEQQYSP